MIYLISDTHFDHENIIRYCKRPFKSVQEMNETIVKNWNSIVGSEDIVYHLGDFSLGKKVDAIGIAKRLKGIKYLIRGNHDKWSTKAYEEMGFNVLDDSLVRLDEYKLLLSHVPAQDIEVPEGYINVHGHIHNNNLYECIENYDPKLYSLEKHLNISCDMTDFRPISVIEVEQKIIY